MTALPHQLDRSLLIRAHRTTVFSFFTDPARWAAWWGAGSSIDARVAGRVLIRHPNGIEVHGEVLEIAPPSHIVFTYATPNGQPASSVVTIRLDEHPAGTTLHLSHAFASPGERDAHVQGWRFHLSQFANRVSDLVNATPDRIVDLWFEAWNEPEASRRDAILDGLVSPGITVTDRYSALTSLDDLRAHLAAVHKFMPGMRLQRRGPVRHCQWRLIADWVAVGQDGAERGSGTNVFDLDADGRITVVTGFWS